MNGYIENQITTEKAVELLSMPLEECNFSIRTFNCLKRNGLRILLDLVSLSFEDIANFRNLGAKSTNEVVKYLKKYGIIELPICVSDDVRKRISEKSKKIQDIAQSLEWLKNINVMDANLSPRATNCLIRDGIKTMYDFAILSLDDANNIRNLGVKSLYEIIDFLKGHGVTFPLTDMDLNSVYLTYKYIKLSENAIQILEAQGFKSLHDIQELSDPKIYELISTISKEDALKVLYSLSTIKNISLNEEYFDSYLRYAVDEITHSIDKSCCQLVSLSFGLFGEKEWPKNIMALSLASSEEELEKELNNILSVYLQGKNYKIIQPLINYINEHSDSLIENGYIRLIKKVKELKATADVQNGNTEIEP